MGFRRNIGATQACRFHDGYLEVEGSSLRYKTDVRVNTDWQCNMFTGPLITFLVIDAGLLYIGNQDGTIVVCDSYGVLQSVHTWSTVELKYVVVGYYNDNGYVREAKLCLSEPDRIVLRGSRRTFVLAPDYHADYPDDEDEEGLAYELSNAFAKGTGLHVTLKEGGVVDETEHGHWEADPNLSTVPALQFG